MPRLALGALPLGPLPLRRLSRSLRRVVARRPWIYWFGVGAAAACAYWAVAAHAEASDRARQAWITTEPVLVAAAALEPGDPLAGATTIEWWPEALRPPGALREVPDGARARQHAAVGEPIGAADVAAPPGPLAFVPAGWLAVPVVESPPSGAELGEAVQVVSDGVVLASSAQVAGSLADRAAAVTLVAVPADDGALVAAAADAGNVTLLRVP